MTIPQPNPITEVVEVRTALEGDEEVQGNYVILRVKHEDESYSDLAMTFDGLRHIAATLDIFDEETRP